MSKIENAVTFMVNIANDNSHGYSQLNRWGNPDYDCSSLVISSWEQAGVPVKTNGATYTGNMYNVFLACGFKDITNQVNMASGNGLERGDVLLNTAYHTAMYIGNGQLVQASGDEYGGIRGDNHGDQTGGEIAVSGYYNYPWDCVLRYVGDNSTPFASKTTNHIQVAHQVLSRGIGWNDEVVDCNTVNSDGYSGYMGKPMLAFRACTIGNDASVCGHLKYRAHIKGGDWYAWRQDYEKDNVGDTFAGDASNIIDGLQMTMIGIKGKKAHYRVHTLNHGWLAWVTEYGNGDEGYAGWYGDAIDAVQVEII